MEKRQSSGVFFTILLVVVFFFSVKPLYAISKMPPFSLQEVNDGRPIDSKDFKGKALLVVFFATSCPPCMAEVPGLIDLQEKLSRNGFSIIAISLDIQDSRTVARTMKKLGVNYPVVMGNGETAAKFGGVFEIPASFLVNQKGDIVKKYIGYVPGYDFSKDIMLLIN